jgi:hypothetical protein
MVAYIDSVCRNIEWVEEVDASSNITDHVVNLVFDSTGSPNANLLNWYCSSYINFCNFKKKVPILHTQGGKPFLNTYIMYL